jgi:hypothetical protein
MPGFDYGQDMVGKVATFMVCRWFLLKSAKDQFLGVDHLGQTVSPCVWHGTACWLIKICFRECVLLGGAEKGMAIPINYMVQEGPLWGNLSNARGASVGKPYQGRSYYLKWIFVKACSYLLASHQRKCDCAWSAWQHGGSLVAERWWNHYAWVQGTNLYRVYNCYNSRAHSQERSGIHPKLEWY